MNLLQLKLAIFFTCIVPYIYLSVTHTLCEYDTMSTYPSITHITCVAAGTRVAESAFSIKDIDTNAYRK